MNLPDSPRQHIGKPVRPVRKHDHLCIGIEDAEPAQAEQKMDVFPILPMPLKNIVGTMIAQIPMSDVVPFGNLPIAGRGQL